MSDDVFPDRDMEHSAKIAWILEESGWCAEPVAPIEDPPTPGYTYTIGFEDHFAHPEVVIFGLKPVAARGLIEMLALHLDAGGELPVGQFVGLLDSDLPAALLPVDLDDHEVLFPMAKEFNGRNFRMRQFVWPDKGGKMPWDEGFDDRLRLAQPILTD